MVQSIETIIVGGGQAGLATSYCLAGRGREHLILEQATQAAHAWRSDRWDSFTLVTPNWTVQLPGAVYGGDDPHGFMPRDEIVAYFERYIERERLPVQYGVRVAAVRPNGAGNSYRVVTDQGEYQARNVVIATGLYQRPKLPPFSKEISAEITQLHSGGYRHPGALPPGAVLVVGSAQSGCQIAEELYQSGRRIYLAVGSAGRVPRRYRGRDIFEWLDLTGFLARTPDMLPSPQARFAGIPHLSGRDGGHTLNLHAFARQGVVLLGRLSHASGDTIWLAPDLKQSLAKSDQFEAELVKMIDAFIQKTGLDAPEERLPELRDGYAVQDYAELSLKSAGISTIIWAMGYHFDFSLVECPVVDSFGYPQQRRGVSEYAGLYFVGLPWLHTQKSGVLLGVGEDAEYIAARIDSHRY